jgi:hypothetical protein
MRTFEDEWIFEVFEDHPSFLTKTMFGGLAVYLFGRMMMVLVEPTRTGRWKWHGVLICTEHGQHPAIIEEFPELASRDVLKKWLYIDSRHEEFEPTMQLVAKAIARDDQRFGVRPRATEGSRSRRKKPKDGANRTARKG